MGVLQVGQEFSNVPFVIRLWIEGGIISRLHPDKLMPGMVVIVQRIEEALLLMYLPGNEEFTVAQTGEDLFLDLLNGELCLVGKDDLAVTSVLFVLT
jgi:hypothetical protein